MDKWEVPTELKETSPKTASVMSATLKEAKIAAIMLEGRYDPEADYLDILGHDWGRLLQNPEAAQDLAEALSRSYTSQAYAILLGVDLEVGGWLDNYDRDYLKASLENGTPPLEAWAEVLGFRELLHLWTAVQAEEVGVQDPWQLREAARWWLCAAQVWNEFGKEALADVSEYGACELLEKLRAEERG